MTDPGRLRRKAQTVRVRPLRLHDARHTFASLALASGKSAAWVASQLGHSEAETTLRVYAHALREEETDLSFLDFGGMELTDEEARGYDASFPDEVFMTGIRTLPSMGALIDEEKGLAASEALKKFDKPFLTIFDQFDMLVRSERAQKALNENIPGAQGMSHGRISAGHFIQESQGEEMARRLIDFIASK